MRVPIHPDDFLPQAAFKKLARSIQKRWPGQSAIQLSVARETLSRGLGYANYSEARLISQTSPFEASTSSETAARAGIATALASALRSANDQSVTHSALEIFVETLPVNALTAFKMKASGTEPLVIFKPVQLDPTLGRVCPVNHTLPATTIPAPADLVTRREMPKPFRRPENLVNQNEVEALRQAVERSGSLRDQSLFSLLESGLRADATLSTQVPHFSSLESSTHHVEIPSRKSRPVVARADTIGKYIDSAGLAPGDYLFPSKNDSETPMSPHELLQVFRSWEKDAQLASPQHSTRSLRNAALLKHVINGSEPSLPEQVATQMGHLSQYTTEHYTILKDTDPASALNEKTHKK